MMYRRDKTNGIIEKFATLLTFYTIESYICKIRGQLSVLMN